MESRLAEALGQEKPDAFFTVGLFSTLDALLDGPIDEVIQDLPLSDEIKSALLNFEGTMGNALRCTLAMEKADWSQADCLDLDKQTICKSYLESIAQMQLDPGSFLRPVDAQC